MPDPVLVGQAVAWVLVLAYAVATKIRQPRAELNDVRQVIRDEMTPFMDLVDKNDHDIATVRKEVGYATARSEYAVRQLTELEGKVENQFARVGESFSARMDELELGIQRIIMDVEEGG